MVQTMVTDVIFRSARRTYFCWCKPLDVTLFRKQPFVPDALASLRTTGIQSPLILRKTAARLCIAACESTSDVASEVRINDPRLVKAIVYESSKGFCNAKGQTSSFSDFLGLQLSSHVASFEAPEDSLPRRILDSLSQDAKAYSEMDESQRVHLLDRVAQIQGFSSTKDLVEHQTAVAEASQDLVVPESCAQVAKDACTSVVFGSSERIELFTEKPSKSIAASRKQNGGAIVKLREDRRRVRAATQTSGRILSLEEETGASQKDEGTSSHMNTDWKLDSPLTQLSCFTNFQKSQLQDNGFFTARNLLNHFPRAHISFDSPTDTLEDGQYIFMLGTVVGTRASKLKENLAMLEVTVSCSVGQECLLSAATGNVDSVVSLHAKRFFQGPRFANHWFLNRISSNYPEGSKVAISGKVKSMPSSGHFEVKDYEIKVIDGDFEHLRKEGKAYPVYPAKGVLQPKKVQLYIQRILACLPADLDPLPEDVRTKYQILNLNQAYAGLHSPNNMEEAGLARRRFVFDDFFYLQLAFLLQRKGPLEDGDVKLLPMEDWSPLVLKIVHSLPFKLTPGQIRAASEIMWDLRQLAPMSRFLQGDVGCGKTIVAFLALLDVASSGYQGALMAPTEFVAAQHHVQFLSWAESLDEKERPRFALLTGTTSGRSIREAIASKDIDIVVGTHALIANTTSFAKLGLAVIDEQHRFGVAQRDRLKGLDAVDVDPNDSKDEGHVKVSSTAHVLLMSATPIPRSLALTLHGDMSLSQITDIPPGRQPTETLVLPNSEEGRLAAYKMIQDELATGGRAFIVYPLIVESSSNSEQQAATVDFEKVADHFKDFKCVLVHGRMKADARHEEMRKFREGDCQILVSTTVIEVGIDIPEASVILIENAETYGVAQLHQLRGRVGRGKRKSRCILLSSSEGSMARLKLLESTTDGFRLAEADLKMRGPGDLLGKRQAGPHQEFVLARLGDDTDILEQARAAAIDLLRTSERKLEALPAKVKHEINMRQLPTSWS